MTTGEEGGLIDSGASHPLRPLKPGENIKDYPRVGVSLADGRRIQLHMTPGNVMISPEAETEPIVPLGDLVEKLGCVFLWKEGGMVIQHPVRGRLQAKNCNGCPQITRALALDLITEIEDFNQGLPKGRTMEDEFVWMQKLVESHPVLSQLPVHVKERLAVSPGKWEDFPLNKRWRRSMQRQGFVVHMYAGEREGHTLEKAWKEVGMDEKLLVELDVKRGSGHDLLPDDGVYSCLIRAALEGKLLGTLGGPNCRTRSVLRRIPKPGAPRPVRAWGGEEYGLEDVTDQEREQVREDDVLLWRQVFLHMVAVYSRRARGLDDQLAFILEQPSTPKKYKPEVVSFWDQWEWKEIKEEFKLDEVHFKQNAMGGEVCKPTTMGTSLELNPDEFQQKPPTTPGKVESSKDLARWPPGVMRMLATALKTQVFKKNYLAKMTWEEHVQYGHVPYRKDCKVCQETMQSHEQHRRARHIQGGVLSLDVAGPMKPAYDMGGGQARWFLAGAFVWRVPKDSQKMKQPEDEELEGGEPQVELNEDQVQGEEIEDEPQGPVFGPEPLGAPGDVDDETEVRVFRLAIPMVTKTSREVTAKAMEMVMKLKADGYHVHRVHSDRGHEFSGAFQKWANSHGLIISKTSGDDSARKWTCRSGR